jgi:hypothetical protein
MSVEVARLAVAGASLGPLLPSERRSFVVRGDAAAVRETLTTVAGAFAAPGSTWLALVTGRSDEVDFCVQLAGVPPDPIRPRLPRGARAGALVLFDEWVPAIAPLLDALAGGRQRLSLLLIGAGGDVEAARALLLVGEHAAAVRRARAGLVAAGGEPEALVVTTPGDPPPPPLRSVASKEAAPPAWALRWAGESSPARNSVAAVEVDVEVNTQRSVLTTVAGLPRAIAAVAATLLVATLGFTGFLVAGHARDAASPAGQAAAGGAPSPGAPGPLRPLFPPPAFIGRPFNALPVARQNAAVAVDPSAGSVVLFGGLRSDGFVIGDTWELTNDRWRPVGYLSGPPPRQGAALAYDPHSRSLVLFGGTSSRGALDDTWTLQRGVWTEVKPAHTPPACWATMATDPVPREPVLVVVCPSATAANAAGPMQVYAWRSGDWVALPQDAPSPVVVAPLVVPDPTPGGSGVLAFSAQPIPPRFPAVWRWSGRHWDAVSPSQPTSLTVLFADSRARAAADTADGVVLLVLPIGNWLWDGRGWSPVRGAVPGPANTAAAVTGLDGTPVAIGGNSPSTNTTTVWAWTAARGWLTIASTIVPSSP